MEGRHSSTPNWVRVRVRVSWVSSTPNWVSWGWREHSFSGLGEPRRYQKVHHYS